MYREVSSQSNKSDLTGEVLKKGCQIPAPTRQYTTVSDFSSWGFHVLLWPLLRACSVESISPWIIFTWSKREILSEHPSPHLGKYVVTPSGVEMTSQSIPIGDFLLSLPVTIELFNRPTNFQKHYKIHLSKLKPFISPSYPWEASSQEAVVKYSETSKTAS